MQLSVCVNNLKVFTLTTTVYKGVDLLTQFWLYGLELSDLDVQFLKGNLLCNKDHLVLYWQKTCPWGLRFSSLCMSQSIPVIVDHPSFLMRSAICPELFYKIEPLLSVFLWVIYVLELLKLMLHVDVLVPSSSHLSQKQSHKEISLAVIICQLTVVYTTKS